MMDSFEMRISLTKLYYSVFSEMTALQVIFHSQSNLKQVESSNTYRKG